LIEIGANGHGLHLRIAAAAATRRWRTHGLQLLLSLLILGEHLLDLVLLLLVQDRRLLLLLLLLLLHHDVRGVTAAVSGPHPGLLLLLLLLRRWPSVRNVMIQEATTATTKRRTTTILGTATTAFVLECSLDAPWMRSCGINMPASRLWTFN
jgi:hypothetical protein